MQLRAEEGMDTVLQSLVLLLGEAEGGKMASEFLWGCHGDIMSVFGWSNLHLKMTQIYPNIWFPGRVWTNLETHSQAYQKQ